MKITSIKQLENLMKVCRRQGVRHMKIEGFEFTLENDVPSKGKSAKTNTLDGATFTGITEDSTIQTPDAPTIDQLIDWSTGASTVPGEVPTPGGNT